jgi:putative holliday junction resolvase
VPLSNLIDLSCPNSSIIKAEDLLLLKNNHPPRIRCQNSFINDFKSFSKIVLGLDIGDKFVGIARTIIPSGIPTPLETVARNKGVAEKKIISLLTEIKCDLIVAGLPLSEDDRWNEQCNQVIRFCRRIERRTSVNILFEDEYHTTIDAEELLSFNRKSKPSKLDIDATSATIILERFLKNF